ncbi:uncharacterized protein LOC124722533 [Schistocerca piceifrons]|uniref:uncharacterized protein LOC124722533 n=1 Tax=Schistocerca piceifrons TaxID=274613 RepID=UPI001F5E4261|nr:uncharacterized protein LOC124722533 [Schistocerca piceifrons]
MPIVSGDQQQCVGSRSVAVEQQSRLEHMIRQGGGCSQNKGVQKSTKSDNQQTPATVDINETLTVSPEDESEENADDEKTESAVEDQPSEQHEARALEQQDDNEEESSSEDSGRKYYPARISPTPPDEARDYSEKEITSETETSEDDSKVVFRNDLMPQQQYGFDGSMRGMWSNPYSICADYTAYLQRQKTLSEEKEETEPHVRNIFQEIKSWELREYMEAAKRPPPRRYNQPEVTRVNRQPVGNVDKQKTSDDKTVSEEQTLITPSVTDSVDLENEFKLRQICVDEKELSEKQAEATGKISSHRYSKIKYIRRHSKSMDKRQFMVVSTTYRAQSEACLPSSTANQEHHIADDETRSSSAATNIKSEIQSHEETVSNEKYTEEMQASQYLHGQKLQEKPQQSIATEKELAEKPQSQQIIADNVTDQTAASLQNTDITEGQYQKLRPTANQNQLVSAEKINYQNELLTDEQTNLKGKNDKALNTHTELGYASITPHEASSTMTPEEAYALLLEDSHYEQSVANQSLDRPDFLRLVPSFYENGGTLRPNFVVDKEGGEATGNVPPKGTDIEDDSSLDELTDSFDIVKQDISVIREDILRRAERYGRHVNTDVINDQRPLPPQIQDPPDLIQHKDIDKEKQDVEKENEVSDQQPVVPVANGISNGEDSNGEPLKELDNVVEDEIGPEIDYEVPQEQSNIIQAAIKNYLRTFGIPVHRVISVLFVEGDPLVPDENSANGEHAIGEQLNNEDSSEQKDNPSPTDDGAPHSDEETDEDPEEDLRHKDIKNRKNPASLLMAMGADQSDIANEINVGTKNIVAHSWVTPEHVEQMQKEIDVWFIKNKHQYLSLVIRNMRLLQALERRETDSTWMESENTAEDRQKAIDNINSVADVSNEVVQMHLFLKDAGSSPPLVALPPQKQDVDMRERRKSGFKTTYWVDKDKFFQE